MILFEGVSPGIYVWLFEKKYIFFIEIAIVLQPKVKRPSAMVYILSTYENSENRYKEATIPMWGYQGQTKGATFTMKIRY